MKRIVLCCDGTWSRADQEVGGKPVPTNVVRFAYLTAKASGDTKQIVYYNQGVGSTGSVVDRMTGGAFGTGLEENIWRAYRFLLANYEVGDELYLFGFSRGAFTARSIAGMIRKCGILKRRSVREYRNAVDLYRDDRHPDDPNVELFRRAHSVAEDDRIPIHFIGVWDTVGSLGIPLTGLKALTARKHQFHDTELSGTVARAYHALAIDERRRPFEPTLWRFKLGPNGEYGAKPGQIVEQVWFPGAHSDVGGGALDRGVSDIALGWMIERAMATGLAMDDEASLAWPLAPNPLGSIDPGPGGLFRFAWTGDRSIGIVVPEGETVAIEDPTQSVHPSALERWDKDPAYRPASLHAHLARIGDPRVTR